MKLAVIPARGGSKRIPRKNVRDFCGKPIIAWSIEAAFASGCFDRVMVSTDDPEIAEVARAHGAEAPFTRPAQLSDDQTPTIPVIAHAIQWHEANVAAVETACCIYATAPFCRAEDIRRGLQILAQFECDYVFPVAHYRSPVQRALQLSTDGYVEMVYPDQFGTRSQDLEPLFHDAGQFYWGSVDAWLSGVHMFLSRSVPMVLPQWRVQDIDTEEDWKLAEFLFRAQQQGDLSDGAVT